MKKKGKRIRLIDWSAESSRQRARALRDAGYVVSSGPLDSARSLKELKSNPPDAVVILLDRLPGQGRDLGIALRTNGRTRLVPLVFAEGSDAKIENTRKNLPDAHFTPWSRIRSTLRRAIAHPPTTPVVPRTNLAAYSGTPLPRKLGMRENETVLLVNSPEGFIDTLLPLPQGIRFRKRGVGKCDLIIWFCPSMRQFQAGLERLLKVLGKGGIWIAWPKKSSGVATDLTPIAIRKGGLEAGLVDFKICSIDNTWSALRFTRQKGGTGAARSNP